MHPYNLSDPDAAVAACVERVASAILADLGIPFTRRFLRDEAARAYVRTTARAVPGEGGEPGRVDWEDAANVALMVAETLKAYHVKHEVVDAPAPRRGTATMVVARRQEGVGYAALLGVVGGGGRLAWPADDPGAARPPREVEMFVALSANEFSGEPKYAAHARAEALGRAVRVLVPALVAGVAGAAVAEGARTAPPLQWAPLLALWAAGIYLSYLLVRLEKTHTYGSAFLARVCGADTGDPTCRLVISSAGSRVLGASLSDVGAVYFLTLACTGALALLTHQLPAFRGVFLAAAVLPLPASVYLVHQQAFVLRRFCALCMGVHAVLLLQAGAVVPLAARGAAVPGLAAVGVTAAVALTVTLAYALAAAAWRLKVDTWLLAAERERAFAEPAHFELAREREPRAELGDVPGSLVLGGPGAPLRLTAVLSLSCEPCAAKWAEMRRLADWFDGGLAVRVVFRADASTREAVAEVVRWTVAGGVPAATAFLERWFTGFAAERARRGNRVNVTRVLARVRADLGPAPDGPGLDTVVDLQAHATESLHMTPLLLFRGRRIPLRYAEAAVLVDVLEQQAAAVAP